MDHRVKLRLAQRERAAHAAAPSALVPGPSWRNAPWLAGAVLVAACLLAPATGSAQGSEPSAADRDAAATAYDRGTSAFLSHDYARAAQWFETAYRLAPNPQALLGAMRAHERNGDLMRAGTLALRATAFHADDPAAARAASATLAQATPLFLRVDVTCTAAEGSASCTVELDGVLASHTSFFVTPDAAHRIVAAFATGNAEASVTGAAGETRSVTLEAPPPPPEGVAVLGPEGGARSVAASDPGGLSPAIFAVGGVLTVAAAGTLIWSGVDTLAGVGPYEADPTPERLADGQSRELRTNVLIGVTGALAVTTVVLGIFTDWDGSPSEEAPASPSPTVTAVSIAPMPSASGDGVDGATLGLSGRF
jgi:hypothetical protein